MNRFGLLCGLASVLACLPLPGQPPARSPFLISRPVPDAAAVERGKTLFVPSCGFCHGPNATGGEGPDLVRSAVALRDEGGNELGPVIRSGRPGMPAFPQMTDAQIKDIASFLRNRQQDAIDRNSYALKNVNTGDAKRGEIYFASHCSQCHSGDKALRGAGARYEESVLMGKILYPGGRGSTPAARPTATVTVAGQAVTGALEYLDDFDIGLRAPSGEYHGYSRTPEVKIEINDPLEGHVKLMRSFQDRELHDVLAYVETLK